MRIRKRLLAMLLCTLITSAAAFTVDVGAADACKQNCSDTYSRCRNNCAWWAIWCPGNCLDDYNFCNDQCECKGDEVCFAIRTFFRTVEP